jgi:fluoroquinolone transport system permease protein
MQTIAKLRTLGQIDLRSALADPMLRLMLVLPLVVAAAIRLLLPALLTQVSALAEVELTWIGPLLSGYVVISFGPLLAGCIAGFLLLDQRDDRTWLALRVTPVPLWLLLAYRLVAPLLLGLPITVAAVAVAGGAGLSFGAALLAALAAAPLAPTTALALAVFARNKVEGLALVKAGSLLLVLPLAALFMPSAWQLPLYALPTFVVAQAVWALQAGVAAWSPIGVSWLLGSLLAALLLRRLR